MSIVIFWLESQTGSEPISCYNSFSDNELMASLDFYKKTQSRPGVSHVVSCAEVAAMVGKRGVSSVEDGKTPDGQDYEWSKAGRAGRFKESDTHKTHLRKDQQ